jgi:4-hydroxy-tetrahydrodipicolinate reductase
MIRVAISGIPGRLATATAAAIAASDDLELVALYNPHRGGEAFNGIPISASHDEIECDVVFESTEPTVVMDNLRAWCEAGLHAVVATSGFTRERLDEVRSFWGEDGPGCLIAPNFSIGHHHDKPDAPSGTAIATAARIAAAGGSSHEESSELVAGSRGAKVEGVRVHSLRLDATLSNQEVALSKSGELLSIHHVGTEYASFADGALLAIRHVADTKGVTVGLDAAIEATAGGEA